MVMYLSEGDPGRAKQIRKASERLVNDYYYQNKVNDLNKLLEHIAYIEYLEEEK
jgi:hypothetical protein